MGLASHLPGGTTESLIQMWTKRKTLHLAAGHRLHYNYQQTVNMLKEWYTSSGSNLPHTCRPGQVNAINFNQWVFSVNFPTDVSIHTICHQTFRKQNNQGQKEKKNKYKENKLPACKLNSSLVNVSFQEQKCDWRLILLSPLTKRSPSCVSPAGAWNRRNQSWPWSQPQTGFLCRATAATYSRQREPPCCPDSGS